MDTGRLEEANVRHTFRGTGNGRRCKEPEIREELFQWFVDVRTSLKGRLPKKLFFLKAQQLYEDCLKGYTLVPPKGRSCNLVNNGSGIGNATTTYHRGNLIKGSPYQRKIVSFGSNITFKTFGMLGVSSFRSMVLLPQ